LLVIKVQKQEETQRTFINKKSPPKKTVVRTPTRKQQKEADDYAEGDLLNNVSNGFSGA